MKTAHLKNYRPNVCAVITNAAKNRVLVFRRTDRRGPAAWQFPQGGIDPGETPRQALLRELQEEIGTDEVDVLAELSCPICYALPEEVRMALAAKGNPLAEYQGQAQYWFLARLREDEKTLNFNGHDIVEFDACRWADPEEAVKNCVPFKREAYRRGLMALGLLPEDEEGEA